MEWVGLELALTTLDACNHETALSARISIVAVSCGFVAVGYDSITAGIDVVSW
jgi:hypothetical protein